MPNANNSSTDVLSRLWYSSAYFDPAKAVPQLRDALRSKESNNQPALRLQLHLSLIRALKKNNQLQQASEELKKLASLNRSVEPMAQAKIKLLNVLLSYAQNPQFDTIEPLTELLAQADKEDLGLQAIANMQLANAHFRKSSFILAKQHFQRALKTYETLGQKADQGSIHLYLARIETALNEYESSTKILANAEQLAQQLQSSELWAGIYHQRAEILRKQGQIEDASGLFRHRIHLPHRFAGRGVRTLAAGHRFKIPLHGDLQRGDEFNLRPHQ